MVIVGLIWLKTRSIYFYESVCNRNTFTVQATGVAHRCQFYRTFYDRSLLVFVINQSVCPCRAFPAWSNVVGKSLQSTLEWSIFRCFAWVGSGLYRKPQTILEKFGPGQTLQLITNIRKLRTQIFITLGLQVLPMQRANCHCLILH